MHEAPAPEAKIQDFQNRSMNVLLGAWCDTQSHAGVTAALAQAGKRVLDEARGGQTLTPKSPRGDAAAE